MSTFYKNKIAEIAEKYEGEVEPVFLPRLTPIIPPKPEYAEILKRFNVKAAILEYYQLEDGVEDWHRYLDYDGALLLSAVMPDQMLCNPSTFKNFLETAEKGFDAVIGWDMPVEVDLPPEECWNNLVKCLEYTVELASKLNVPVIPLSKGANREQAEAYINALSKLGFKTIALHASEYAQNFFKEGLARKLLETHWRLIDKYAEQGLIIGVLNPKIFAHLKRLDKPKFSYAGLSWLIHGMKGYAYARYKTVDLREKSIVLSDTGEVLEYPGGEERIVEHNLEYVLNMVTGAGERRLQLYDIALEGKTVVVADLHAGTPESMLEELLSLLRDEYPDNIVFLGDTLDLQRGELLALEAVKLFGGLTWIPSKILAVKGDTDSNFAKVLNIMDQALTLQESWRRLPKPGKPTNYHILALYKFYRKALDTAAVYLPDGSTAYMLHGHQIGPSPDAIRREAKRIKRETRAEWVFTAHTHKPEINREEGIANPGCWTRNGENPGTYILIEKDGGIELLEEF